MTLNLGEAPLGWVSLEQRVPSVTAGRRAGGFKVLGTKLSSVHPAR